MVSGILLIELLRAFEIAKMVSTYRCVASTHLSRFLLQSYFTLTALQYIYQSLVHTILASLLNRTCFCADPSLTACPLSYLCFILDRAVFTIFLPIDQAWNRLTCDAFDFIWDHPEVAAAIIFYQILGQPLFLCPMSGPCDAMCPL